MKRVLLSNMCLREFYMALNIVRSFWIHPFHMFFGCTLVFSPLHSLYLISFVNLGPLLLY